MIAQNLRGWLFKYSLKNSAAWTGATLGNLYKNNIYRNPGTCGIINATIINYVINKNYPLVCVSLSLLLAQRIAASKWGETLEEEFGTVPANTVKIQQENTKKPQNEFIKFLVSTQGTIFVHSLILLVEAAGQFYLSQYGPVDTRAQALAASQIDILFGASDLGEAMLVHKLVRKVFDAKTTVGQKFREALPGFTKRFVDNQQRSEKIGHCLYALCTVVNLRGTSLIMQRAGFSPLVALALVMPSMALAVCKAVRPTAFPAGVPYMVTVLVHATTLVKAASEGHAGIAIARAVVMHGTFSAAMNWATRAGSSLSQEFRKVGAQLAAAPQKIGEWRRAKRNTANLRSGPKPQEHEI